MWLRAKCLTVENIDQRSLLLGIDGMLYRIIEPLLLCWLEAIQKFFVVLAIACWPLFSSVLYMQMQLKTWNWDMLTSNLSKAYCSYSIFLILLGCCITIIRHQKSFNILSLCLVKFLNKHSQEKKKTIRSNKLSFFTS